MGIMIIVGVAGLIYGLIHKSSKSMAPEAAAAAVTAPFTLPGAVEMIAAGDAVVVRAGEKFYVIDPGRARARVVTGP